MPDGPSTAVVTLSVLGLAFDLIGAFLLSIPMVWSSEKAAFVCRSLARRLWTENRTTVFFAVLGVSYLCASFVRILGLGSLWGEEWWASVEPYAALAVYGYLLSVFLIFCLDRLFRRLAEGNHDRRIGAFGLVLLSIGFILQFVVNMQWVH